MLPKTYTQTLSFTYNSCCPKSYFVGKRGRIDITKVLAHLKSEHNEDLSGLNQYQLETLKEKNFAISLKDDDYQENYIQVGYKDSNAITLYFFDSFRVEDYEIVEFYTEGGNDDDEDVILVIRGKFVFDIVEQYSAVWDDWENEWKKKLIYKRSAPSNISVDTTHTHTH